MKKLSVFALIIIFQLFTACSSDDSPSDNGQDYLIINGLENSMILTGNEIDFYYFKGYGGYDVDGQTGNHTSVYYSLNLVDPNHEFVQNFTPNFNQTLDLKFIIGMTDHSGNCTTTLNDTATLADNQVYSEFLADNQTSIPAAAGQVISIKENNTKTVIKFSDVNYGSNVISGKIVYNLN